MTFAVQKNIFSFLLYLFKNNTFCINLIELFFYDTDIDPLPAGSVAVYVALHATLPIAGITKV